MIRIVLQQLYTASSKRTVSSGITEGKSILLDSYACEKEPNIQYKPIKELNGIRTSAYPNLGKKLERTKLKNKDNFLKNDNPLEYQKFLFGN